MDFLNKTISYNSVLYNNQESDSFTTQFSDENAEYFIKYANMYGFFKWKESYIKDGNVKDGTQTNITIEYMDNSLQTIECYAEFPNTYDEMQEVFYEAFGYNML
mgnify:CR=1 FL=1